MATLNEAKAALEIISGLIAPHCDRIELAGSVRRNKRDVGDAELCVIGKPSLWPAVDELLATGVIGKASYGATGQQRWGKKYRGLTLSKFPFTIEIWRAEPSNFGYIWWLRTGSGEANRRIMSYINRVNAPIRFRDGECVWARGGWVKGNEDFQPRNPAIIPTPTEQVIYDLFGIPFVEPQNRDVEVYADLFKSPHQFPTDLTPYLPKTNEQHSFGFISEEDYQLKGNDKDDAKGSGVRFGGQIYAGFIEPDKNGLWAGMPLADAFALHERMEWEGVRAVNKERYDREMRKKYPNLTTAEFYQKQMQLADAKLKTPK